MHVAQRMEKYLVLFCTDVTVSIQAVRSIFEGDEMVQVCAVLSADANTERNFTITLTTADYTGIRDYNSIRK